VQINETKFKFTLIDIGFFSKKPKNETTLIVEPLNQGIINISRETQIPYSILIHPSHKHPEFYKFVSDPSKLKSFIKIIEVKKGGLNRNG